MRFQKLDEWADRFEAIAGFLSHKDKRNLDLQVVGEMTGYAENLLRDTVKKVGEKLELLERTTDHEGTWYSLRVDPFSAPPSHTEEDREQPESQMERLYRECCDQANEGVRKVILKLDVLRGSVEPPVGAMLMDAVVDLHRLSILLTKISAAGVKGDRRDYIEALREQIDTILRGSA